MDSVTDMMHSREHFTWRTRKRLTDLEAENLKDIEVKLKRRNESICSRRKVENYQEGRARRRPDPQRFLGNSQLAVLCWLCHSQKVKKFFTRLSIIPRKILLSSIQPEPKTLDLSTRALPRDL